MNGFTNHPWRDVDRGLLMHAGLLLLVLLLLFVVVGGTHPKVSPKLVQNDPTVTPQPFLEKF